MSSPTVLLLGAGGNAGRNYVKCLKLADPEIFVVGLDINKYGMARSNVDHIVQQVPEGYDILHQISGLVDEYGIDFIHAQPDRLVRFLFGNPELSHLITRGSVDEWYWFHDKLGCARKWAAYGLALAPVALTQITSASFADLAAQGQGAVWCRAARGAGSRAALPVNDWQQAIAWAEYWRDYKGLSLDDFMLSPYLPGPEYAVQMFFINGELVHAQARERVEYHFAEQMPSGQSSTPSVARTVDSPNVYDAAVWAVKLIQPKPHGIYGVDMKTSAEDQLIPTEVNYGRYFTTSDFFATAGMNTPYMELQYHLTGEKQYCINWLEPDQYWMRALDMEPVLVTNSEG